VDLSSLMSLFRFAAVPATISTTGRLASAIFCSMCPSTPLSHPLDSEIHVGKRNIRMQKNVDVRENLGAPGRFMATVKLA